MEALLVWYDSHSHTHPSINGLYALCRLSEMLQKQYTRLTRDNSRTTTKYVRT